MRAPERLSDAMLASLVENADDAVIVADASGAIQYWNPASEAMFGYTSGEAIGASLDIIVPAKLRERHWEGYRRVMASGQTEYAGRMLAVPAVRADGTRISVEFTVTLLRDSEGTLWGIGAIMRDVTARWHEQRELRRELETLKRDVASPTG
jgi:PAS domain S-box-containing protein